MAKAGQPFKTKDRAMTTRTLVEVSTDGLSTIEDSYIINNFTECLAARNTELDAVRGFVSPSEYNKLVTGWTKFQTQATRGMLTDEDDMIIVVHTLPGKWSSIPAGHISYCFSIRTDSKHAL